MSFMLKEYRTTSGEIILYNGNPNFEHLETLIQGPGDIWHSSWEQGYKNAFPEIVYQSATFWYINDFNDLDEAVSWRINPYQFCIRKSVWNLLGGFDADFESLQAQALFLGYMAVRYKGAVPLYVKGLFQDQSKDAVVVSAKDRYVFYRKSFKTSHSLFMLYRKGWWKLSEWRAFNYTRNKARLLPKKTVVPPRELQGIVGKPKVSYIIPTMSRQDFTLQLLKDLKKQTYGVDEVIIVDATPEEAREKSYYNSEDYDFRLIVQWQETKGSCRARNEAIAHCNGDYIVFGDDDIRIPPDFIENHIRLLQTYNAGACNGLDIRADHQQQTLEDLQQKLIKFDEQRWISGASQSFSNANSCVKKEYVNLLKGNDINFDGGYGEDSDFGLSLSKLGVTVMHNPFSANLHLKPPVGGYRSWGEQAKIIGKKRKKQPWELDTPVKWIRPVPSPTIMYMILKQFTPQQVQEYKQKYFILYLFKGSKWKLPLRIIRLPYRLLQFRKSVFYARKLMQLGIRIK
ncbi:glycosyltransferase family 2 protein [Flavobacterium kingsejongi]|uniref:Family 2 glycosyl transferase n=1 Tax=Flavobacterium kingsejongi TaxID=1678728 RepID=A0A2S1LNR3_9FLAO|nr:glycosyltransferase family 2 protein [Flavobacterium kingsejongi]AWG25395.1 family 2 glycosyl transferase [Flavobacterium kingsejongi]